MADLLAATVSGGRRGKVASFSVRQAAAGTAPVAPRRDGFAIGVLHMSLDYLLTTGALLIAFVVLMTLLREALIGSMAIKTYLFSLPLG